MGHSRHKLNHFTNRRTQSSPGVRCPSAHEGLVSQLRARGLSRSWDRGGSRGMGWEPASLLGSSGSGLWADTDLQGPWAPGGGLVWGTGSLEPPDIPPPRGPEAAGYGGGVTSGKPTGAVWPQFPPLSNRDNIIAFLSCSCPDSGDPHTSPPRVGSSRPGVYTSLHPARPRPRLATGQQKEGSGTGPPCSPTALPRALPLGVHMAPAPSSPPGRLFKVAHLQSYSSRLHHLKCTEKGTPSTSAGAASNFSKSQISHSRKMTSVPAVGHCYSTQRVISWH